VEKVRSVQWVTARNFFITGAALEGLEGEGGVRGGKGKKRRSYQAKRLGPRRGRIAKVEVV